MFEILFDDPQEELEVECSVRSNNLKVNTFNANVNGNPPAMFQNRNLIEIKYDRNLIGNESEKISGNIYDAEVKFLNRLLSNPKYKDKFCWITCYGGTKTCYEPTKGNVNIKKNLTNNLYLSFNDKLKIDYNNENIGVEKINKLLEHKIANIHIKFMFYAIVKTTKDSINISIKLKLKELKILELKDQILSLFQVDVQNKTRQFEYLQRYPTGKKKTVNNILQLFSSS